MSRIPRTGRRLTMPARRAKRCWQSAPSTASASQTADSTSADRYPVVGPLSFRRIVGIPYQTCVAALGGWQGGNTASCRSARACCAGRSSATATRAPAGSRSGWPAGRCAHGCG